MVLSSTRVVWRGADLDERVLAGAARGVNLALERLLALATPLTPYLDGGLQQAYGIHQVQPTEASLTEGGQLQNSAEYAAFQHEGGDATRHIDESKRARNVHPQAQSKFVEAPLRAHSDELYEVIGQSIREALG